MSKEQAFNRLVEIREEMEDMIRETEKLMRKEFSYEYQNAEVYWIAHMKTAMGNMGYHTYSTTFAGALESIEGEVYETEEEEEEEEENYFE
jgi:hypothetical protein